MFLKLLSAFLILAGLFFALFGVSFIFQGYAAEGWSRTEGEVVSVSVEVDVSINNTAPNGTRRSSGVRRYYPSIAYTWTVDGERFEGSRYRLGETHEAFLDRGDALKAAQRFRNGESIPVYYSAERPDQAVLDPSLSVGVFVPLPIGLLLLVSGWGLLRSAPAIEEALRAQHAASQTADGSRP